MFDNSCGIWYMPVYCSVNFCSKSHYQFSLNVLWISIWIFIAFMLWGIYLIVISVPNRFNTLVKLKICPLLFNEKSVMFGLLWLHLTAVLEICHKTFCFTDKVVITFPIMHKPTNQPHSLFLKKSKNIKRKDIKTFMSRKIHLFL